MRKCTRSQEVFFLFFFIIPTALFPLIYFLVSSLTKAFVIWTWQIFLFNLDLTIFIYIYMCVCVCVCVCVSLKENKNVVAKRKKIKVFTVSVSQGSLLEFGANGSLPSENKLCLFGLLDFDPRLQNRAPAWFNNCGLLVNFQPLPACECCVGAYLKRAVSNRECI